MSLQTTLSENGLSFFNPKTNIGIKDFSLRLVISGKPEVIQLGPAADSEHSLIAAGRIGNALDVTTTASRLPQQNAVVLTHSLTNITTESITVEEAATGQFRASAKVLHGLGSWLGWELRYCHTDNVRTERYPHCQMEYPYERMLPTTTVELGRGEDQSFPALWVKDERSRSGLVLAAASQELHYTTFVLRKRAMVNESVFEEFFIRHDPGHCGGFVIAAGETLQLDGIFIQLAGDVPTEDVFSGYIDYLTTWFQFRGATSRGLDEAFHCTWNYGPFSDQTEASLLPTARFIAANLPGIKWFLMDAGYVDGKLDSTFLDQFYPDPDAAISAERFPNGILGFTDQLRGLGLRPGLWWSPTAIIESRLYQDHPEWFLRSPDGTPFLIEGKQGFLDYSHPEALEFLDRTLAHILGHWGMDACKMDFWSQNFETRTVRLHDPGVTSVQARAQLFETVRRHLPADGIFMTCVATGLGNPFIGQWADTYRNTIDIGLGVWQEQRHNCFWALPTLGFQGRKTYLPNHDSAGIMAEYPDHENEFRLTWCHMNMGLLETGGRMETWPEKWVRAMGKLTARCDRGHRVRCPDERAFTGIPLPESLFVDYPADSRTGQSGIRQSVALFNWSDEPKVISISLAHLGHTAPMRGENFWTGEREIFEDDFITRPLAGRSALLWDILSREN